MNKSKISEIANKIVEKNSSHLIEMIIRGNESNPVIEIFIDNEIGISTEDCTKISCELSEAFSEMDDLSKNYRLDVSSPGIDRPLSFLFQYTKHIDRKFDVTYELDGQKIRKIVTLKNVDDDLMVFVDKNSEIKLKIDQIIKAKVIVSF